MQIKLVVVVVVVAGKSPLTLRLASRTYEQRLCHPYNLFPCRPCAFDGPSDRVA